MIFSLKKISGMAAWHGGIQKGNLAVIHASLDLNLQAEEKHSKYCRYYSGIWALTSRR